MAFLFTLLLFAGTLILSEVLRPKPKFENAKAATLSEFEVPTATEGRPVPVIWGTVKVASPNVVWYGDLITQAIKEKVKTGLFSSENITVGYRYYIGAQLAVCRGPIEAYTRIWANDKELYGTIFSESVLDIDEPKFFGGEETGQGGIRGRFSTYVGNANQLPNSYLSTHTNEQGDTPAYTGTAYVALERIYIGTNPRLPQFNFEVRRIPRQLSSSFATMGFGDANPAHVIYEMITNTEWGLGFPSADVDTSNFLEVAETLFNEGNGFSYALTQETTMSDMLDELQRQIDGIVFTNPQTGQWQIKLIRDDYDPLTVPGFDDSNIIKFENYTKGSWDDTSNQVRVDFVSRELDYKRTSAKASDSANYEIQSRANRPTAITFLAVKNSSTANDLAWRELKQLSLPRAKATITMNRRKVTSLSPGSVIKVSWSRLGITDVLFRINNMTESDSDIRIEVVEDVFGSLAPASAQPPATGWDPPQDQMLPVPLADHAVFEAPRTFVRRANANPDSIWFGVMRQGDSAAFFNAITRVAPSAFAENGTANQFVIRGELNAALDASASPSVASVSVLMEDSNPYQLFPQIEDSQIGVDLFHIGLLGNEELVGWKSAADGGGLNMTLSNVYRGLFDTVPRNWPSGTKLKILSASPNDQQFSLEEPGGSLTNSSLPATALVDFRALTESPSDALSEAGATNFQVQMSNRYRRPYPPTLFKVGATAWPSASQSIDNATDLGGGIDQVGLDIRFRRRDYDTRDEVASITSDTAGLTGAFPGSTQYRVNVVDDPGGAATDLGDTQKNAGTDTVVLTRTRLVRQAGGSLPSTVRLGVVASHTVDSVEYDARHALEHEIDVTSGTLAGRESFGVAAAGSTSPSSYTATEAGTYNLQLGTATTAGAIQYRLNGGAWTTSIAQGDTLGTIPGVSVSDTIELRAEAGATSTAEETMVLMSAPVSGNDAYFIATF